MPSPITRTLAVLLLTTALLTVSGCLLTKVVTVPMRVVGAGISVIPVAGNTAHDAIDEGAEIIDDAPF